MPSIYDSERQRMMRNKGHQIKNIESLLFTFIIIVNCISSRHLQVVTLRKAIDSE